MRKRVFSIMGLSFLFAEFALVAVLAQAQNLDDKIGALEQELSQLKSEQLELKKQATEAAAALPTFKYDPGSGVRIEAADKAWALQLSHEIDWLMPFESGQSHVGRTYMEVMGRRFRQEWTLCINNCFYEVWSRLDLDGFGTNSGLQRAQAHIHFENINPWLPTIYFGMDIVATGGQARQGSSATGAQAEYDLLSRNNGFNTGGTGTGVAVAYRSIDLGGIGIPGSARFNFVFGSVGVAGDGGQRGNNKKDIAAYFDISPFRDLKNDWLRGFTFEMMGWFCNYDGHLESTTTTSPALAISSAGPVTAGRIDQVIRTQPNTEASACSRLRIRDHGTGGRQTLFDSGLITGGMAHYLAPGIRWQVGPYNFRAYMGFNRYTDADSLSSTSVRVRFQESTSSAITQSTVTTNLGSVGKKSGRVWLIAHDLWLWSPKGFLTGDANTPGSVLFGTHFERTDVSCGNDGSTFVFGVTTGGGVQNGGTTRAQNAVCNRITLSSSTSRSEFTRNRILLREWDLWYFIAPRASVGVNVLWYDAKNLPSGFSSSGGITNDVQKALGAGGSCRNRAIDISTPVGPPRVPSYVPGNLSCGGAWTDVWLRLRWSF